MSVWRERPVLGELGASAPQPRGGEPSWQGGKKKKALAPVGAIALTTTMAPRPAANNFNLVDIFKPPFTGGMVRTGV
jgi:hypothetical protein